MEKTDKNTNKPNEGRFVPKYYNEICGSPNAGSLLAQIKYWWKIKKEKEFPKSLIRFAKEIEVSYGKARNAEEILIELGFIKIDVRQVGYAPKLTHWTFCEDEVEKAIMSFKNDRSIMATKNSMRSPEQTVCSRERTVRSPEQTVCSQERTHKDIVLDIVLDTILNSSSLEAPLLESQAVPVQAEKEDYNKHYGKSEQPEESPVRPIEAYVHRAQELPPQASNANAVQPVDLKGVAERKIEIWNDLCPVAKCEAKDFIFGLNSRFVDSFNRSFDEWEEYCRKIASSKFLMGERPMHNGSFYRLSLTWALSLKNIADVKNGKYDSDRLIVLTPRQLADSTQKILNTQKQEALGGIENSNLEGWVKELKRAWLEKFGVSAYWRFNNAVLVEKQDGHLNFIARTNEMEKFMADKKPDIQEMLSLTGMTHEVKLWNERTWRNRERPLLSHAPLMENSVDISGAIQSFVQNMRLPGSPGKPTPLEDFPDLSEQCAYHTQPSIRNALINATERFANRA